MRLLGLLPHFLALQLFVLSPTAVVLAQVSTFPYAESFDGVTTPALPSGWTTTTNRLGTGDFFSTTTSPRSSPNAVQSTNSTISQGLISPLFDFTNRVPGTLRFYMARSGTHTSGVLVEASTNGGTTFPIPLSDTLLNPGVTSYILTTLPLPGSLSNEATVKFRWRVVGGLGGTTATLRIDDVSLSIITQHDLTVRDFSTIPQVLTSDDPFQLRAFVHNTGNQPASGYEVDFFYDANANAIPETSEKFATVTGPTLGVGDSALIAANHPALPFGDHRFFAVVAYSQDENTANNSLSATVAVGYTKGTLIFNEIMFDPLAGQNEWLELYNRSSDAVNLSGWRFSDRPTAGGTVVTITITNQPRIVQPGEFVIVAAESSFFNLFPALANPPSGVHVFIANRSAGFSFNNDNDDIILRDHLGTGIDSVSYSNRWHNPNITDTRGRSLERINPNLDSNDPRNWSTCAALVGGSPGQPNTIFTTAVPSDASLSISPNPFSPDSDGFEDFCIIKYNLPSPASTIRIRIFDIKGRLIRTLADMEPAGAHGEFIWDGLDDGRQRVRVGTYVVLVEGAVVDGGNVSSARAVVVVATKL